MWVSSLLLYLVIRLGEAGYTGYGGSSSTSRSRPINDNDYAALDAAVPKIRAQYGSKRSTSSTYSSYPEAKNTGTLDFGKLGGLSNDQIQQQVASVLSNYPGATYSMGGRDGKVIQGEIPRAGSPPRTRSQWRPPTYTPPTSASPSSGTDAYYPSSNFRKPSPSRNNYIPEQVNDAPKSNYGISQGLQQGSDYTTRPQSQGIDYRQRSQPKFGPRKPTLESLPSSRYDQNIPDNVVSQPQQLPSNYNNAPVPETNQQQSQPTEALGDNEFMSVLGGERHRNWKSQNKPQQAQTYQPAPQNQEPQNINDNDASPLGGLFGGGQETAPPPKPATKPATAFNPTDGLQAADNLATSIVDGLDYILKSEGQMMGSTKFYLDVCEKAVSAQQPALQAMKRHDRTLMDILPVWRDSLANKIAKFFRSTLKDPSYYVGSPELDVLMTIMGECVRPKLVLTRI